MKVVLLVPWRGGDAWRDWVWWEYVGRKWTSYWYPLFLGGEQQTGPFNRAAAKNEAASKAGDWDIGVFVDADVVISSKEQLDTGIVLAARTGRLVLPFEWYSPLDKEETEKLLGGRMDALPIHHPEPHQSVGGVVIVPRKRWDMVGGFHEGFIGWGYEDSVFHTMAGGSLRTPGELWHLWHPVSDETDPQHPLHISNRETAEKLGYKIP